MHNTPSHKKKIANRLDAVDALRGIAALVVVIFHARGELWIGISELYREYGFNAPPSVWLGYATYPFSFGWLGVTLFFAISGYCIHRRVAKELASNKTYRLDLNNFAKRRFWRIYPTYAIALIIGGLVDLYLLSPILNIELAASHSLSSFFSTLTTLQGYIAKAYGTNAVFWTLAMEIHLYLAYPILLWISKQRGPLFTLLFTAAVSIGFIILDAAFGIQEKFPYKFVRGPIFFPYWFTWTVGIYLAEVEAGRANFPASPVRESLLIIGIIGGLTISLVGRDEHSEVFWALVAGYILHWSLSEKSNWLWKSFLGAWLSRLGVFSFSLYAIHYPCLLLFRQLFLGDNEKSKSLLMVVFGTGFSIMASYIFFHLVEKWTIQTARPKNLTNLNTDT
jgi:peptidoglycan/LPS O-acetylase OafA/YrhL